MAQNNQLASSVRGNPQQKRENKMPVAQIRDGARHGETNAVEPGEFLFRSRGRCLNEISGNLLCLSPVQSKGRHGRFRIVDEFGLAQIYRQPANDPLPAARGQNFSPLLSEVGEWLGINFLDLCDTLCI